MSIAVVRFHPEKAPIPICIITTLVKRWSGGCMHARCDTRGREIHRERYRTLFKDSDILPVSTALCLLFRVFVTLPGRITVIHSRVTGFVRLLAAAIQHHVRLEGKIIRRRFGRFAGEPHVLGSRTVRLFWVSDTLHILVHIA